LAEIKQGYSVLLVRYPVFPKSATIDISADAVVLKQLAKAD
jgi:hypothetical protein